MNKSEMITERLDVMPTNRNELPDKYAPPRIVHVEELETVASTCAGGSPPTFKQDAGSCPDAPPTNYLS